MRAHWAGKAWNQIGSEASHISAEAMPPLDVCRYGSRPGLGTLYCEGRCKPGSFCGIGTAVPRECPPGHYCPDGEKAWACPAGTFGEWRVVGPCVAGRTGGRTWLEQDLHLNFGLPVTKVCHLCMCVGVVQAT